MVYSSNYSMNDYKKLAEPTIHEHRHIAKIHVSPDLILKMLNLKGATLMNVELNTATWPPGYDFTVEHPTMPPLRFGEVMVVIEHDREASIHTDD